MRSDKNPPITGANRSYPSRGTTRYNVFARPAGAPINQSRSTHWLRPSSAGSTSVTACTFGSRYGSATVCAVAYTDDTNRSSFDQIARRCNWAASAAARTSGRFDLSDASMMVSTSDASEMCGRSCLNTHSATLAIEGPAGSSAAAPNRPVNRIFPEFAQKSPPPSMPAFGVHAANASPAFFAPVGVVASRSGDHRANSLRGTSTQSSDGTSGLRSTNPDGSNTRTSPSWRRRLMVASSRSRFTDNNTAGPSQSSTPGMAHSAVLPERDGPTMATEEISPGRTRRRRSRALTAPTSVAASRASASATRRFWVATNHRP